MKVDIVGTDHRVQVDDGSCTPAQLKQFTDFIETCATSSRVAAIAEELSQDVLAERGRPHSVCGAIASRLGILHRYCDPGRSIRDRDGILQESDLQMEVFFGRLSEADLPHGIRVEHAKRESIWLSELRTLNIWPVLFVCGAKHAMPFADLLRSNGVDATVVDAGWLPNPPLQPAGVAGG